MGVERSSRKKKKKTLKETSSNLKMMDLERKSLERKFNFRYFSFRLCFVLAVFHFLLSSPSPFLVSLSHCCLSRAKSRPPRSGDEMRNVKRTKGKGEIERIKVGFSRFFFSS